MSNRAKLVRHAALLLCVAVLSGVGVQGSEAATKKLAASITTTQKVLAIIDTGLDPRTTAISKNVVSEACFSHNDSCPNGESFMAGASASVLPQSAMSNSIFEHGTEVVSAAISANPQVKILEVRCSSVVNETTWEGCNYTDIASALQYLYQSKDLLKIGAVVLPMATNPSKSCDADDANEALVKKFTLANIPVVASSGNNGIYDAVSNPACIPGVLAISAVDGYGRIASYANYSDRVDFAAQGDFTVTIGENRRAFAQGTSLSAGAFGAQWLNLAASKNFTMKEELSWISAHAVRTAAPVGRDTVKVFLGNF